MGHEYAVEFARVRKQVDHPVGDGGVQSLATSDSNHVIVGIDAKRLDIALTQELDKFSPATADIHDQSPGREVIGIRRMSSALS